MPLFAKEELFTKRWFVDYGLITTGSFIMAAGFVFFITPHRIVPGGIYGLGIIVHYLTKGMTLWPEGFPIGLFNLLVNIPLTYFGIKLLGQQVWHKNHLRVCFIIGIYGHNNLDAYGW